MAQLIHVCIFQLLIISLTFAAFTIDSGTADRITVTITLFLTAVAFKLVVKQSLPTISYLTYLVWYNDVISPNTGSNLVIYIITIILKLKQFKLIIMRQT